MNRFRLVMIGFLLLMTMSMTACNLVRDQEVVVTNTPPVDAGGKPSVTIASPSEGEQIQVSREVLVSATATDTVGVTRVQLFANGQIVKSVLSENPTGDTVKSVVLDYTPQAEGQVTLRVVAYRGTTASDPAEVTVNVVRSNQVTLTPGSVTNTPAFDPGDPTCRALVNTGLNLRSGPSTAYEVIRVLSAGEILPVIGRLGDNSWWQVRAGVLVGWVSAGFTTTYGANCTFVPVVAPPASVTPNVTATWTPTASPTPTATPTVTNTPGIADLIITNLTGPDTVTIPSGDSVVQEQFSVTVTNTGTRRTGQFTLELRVLPNGDSQQVVVGNLREGESAAFEVDLEFTQAGNFTLVAEADVFDEVTETNAANNTASRAVVVIQN